MSAWDAVIRIGLALVAGAMLGFERELSDKPAGIRTYALVCEGAALFMVIGILLAQQSGVEHATVDPTRIASTVVQGIGFLAGGVIFTIRERVKGLTTAAGIWVAAAIGLAIGGGFYILAFAAVIMSLLALRALMVVDRFARLRGARDISEGASPQSGTE